MKDRHIMGPGSRLLNRFTHHWCGVVFVLECLRLWYGAPFTWGSGLLFVWCVFCLWLTQLQWNAHCEAVEEQDRMNAPPKEDADSGNPPAP